MTTQKTSLIYECINCDFICSKKGDFNRHISTQKHLRLQNTTNFTSHHFTCENCNKVYKHHSSLWKHSKTCIQVQTQTQTNHPNTTNHTPELIVELVKQNQEFKQMLVEQNAKIIELSSKPTYMNSNNNNKTKFNLNFFLNEQCKDALNITDFVNSLKLSLTDLENTGKYGFVQGISQIFIRGLKELDIYKRPIHCSDLKRETIYVKDQNVWEKENEERIKLYKTIHQIANKNVNQITSWMMENPNCSDYYSTKNDQYLQIVNESIGGVDSDENNKYYDKIVKNMSKEVVISTNTTQ
jgi:hypothetical protein